MKILKGIVNVVLITIILLILFISIFYIISLYVIPDKLPNFFGWKSVIVLTTQLEEMNYGDIAIIQETNFDNLEIGNIIAFEKNNEIMVNKITGKAVIDGKRVFLVKQNNDMFQTDLLIYEKEIEGIYQYRIPRIGNFILYSKTPFGIISCFCIPLMILILKNIFDLKKEKRLLKNVINKY